MNHYNRAVHWFGLATAVVALTAVALGSYVSSSGYGLAIPDWPLSNGRLIPETLPGGVFYNYAHRMISALLGFMTLMLGVYLWTRDERPEVQRLGLIAIALVIVQIVLGGVGVLAYFPSLVKIFHAGLAQVFFGIVVAASTMVSPAWLDDSKASMFDARTVRRNRGLAWMVLIQVLLGAVLRHVEIGAIYAGALLIHLLLALGILIAGVTTGWVTAQASRLTALTAVSWAAMLLVVVQVLVGIGVLVVAPGVGDAGGQPPAGYVGQSVIHVAGGALLLGLTLYMALLVGRNAESAAD